MQTPTLKLKSNVLTLSYSKGDLDCKQALAQLQSSKQPTISGKMPYHDDCRSGDNSESGYHDDIDVGDNI